EFTGTVVITASDPPGGAPPQSSGLIKTGAGRLTLAGANTYTGGTWLQEGTLDIAAGSTAGPVDASGNNLSSGTIRLNGGTTLVNAGDIGMVQYYPVPGQPGGAQQPVTVTNTGTVIGANGISLFNGSITNSG